MKPHLRPNPPPHTSSTASPSTIQALRPVADTMVQRVVDDIVAALPPHAADPGTPRHQLLLRAARVAARHFLDDGAGPIGTGDQVDELFRRLGRTQAKRDHDWTTLDTSLHVATRASWHQLVDFATTHDLTRPELQHLADALFTYLDHVRDQLTTGYQHAHHTAPQTRHRARTRLIELYTTHTSADGTGDTSGNLDPDTLAALAETAEWPLPDEVTTLAISYHGEPPTLHDTPTLLIHHTDPPGRTLVVAPTTDHHDLITHISRTRPGLRIARSWPVPPTQAGNALRWCNRALDLVHQGVIAPHTLIDCATHATQLWLHAEPSMRQHLCQELLHPLLAETPHSRAILSETLLTWVETRDSAPAIAARLDVHPQTIRYRWKRINELFGDTLRDPESTLRMTLVLKSSVPLWKAGDHTDFDLFHQRTTT